MKKNLRYLHLKTTVICLFLNLVVIASKAQITGTRTVPGNYASIAAAVTALNTNGTSGNVIINVAPNHSETAPAGGIVLGSTTLNASLSASSTLTISRNYAWGGWCRSSN